MSLRVNIPLPGPFSVSTSSHGRRVTVWRHPGCHVQHPSRAAADQHHAALAARTPAQLRRDKIVGRTVGWAVAGSFAAAIIAGYFHFLAGLQ